MKKEFAKQPEPLSSDQVSRRRFMIRMIAGLGLGTVSVLFANIGRYFIAPIWDKTEDSFIPIRSMASLPKGFPLSVEYIHRERDGWEIHEGRNSLWLLREDNDQVTAFSPKCTHLGCPYRWDEKENVFKCPCHTAVFSKTGEVISGPPKRPLDRFPVKINNGIVLVKPESIEKEEA